MAEKVLDTRIQLYDKSDIVIATVKISICFTNNFSKVFINTRSRYLLYNSLTSLKVIVKIPHELFCILTIVTEKKSTLYTHFVDLRMTQMKGSKDVVL
jgi:hypothetical protein